MSRISKPIVMPPLVADVAAPTVTPQGTPGVVTWDYKVVAIDANGKKTAASTAGQTTTGHATLDGTNFNRITWTDVTGGVTYEIHRTAAGGTPGTTGLIGTVDAAVQTFDDTGLAISDATAPNATNTTGDGAESSHREYGHGPVQVYATGIGTGTYQLQTTGGGSSGWVNEGSALTADGTLTVTKVVAGVRFKCTAFTSGTPVGWAVGAH